MVIDANLKNTTLDYVLSPSGIYLRNGNNGLAWKDTNAFREAAINFQNNGFYTPYTEGSYQRNLFWDVEEERIMNGMVHPKYPNQRISGLGYLYLNYCPIYNKKLKRFEFPDFWDLDQDWFEAIEAAETDGEHILGLKCRQRGFSLKDMVPVLKEFYFGHGAICYITAYLKTHASKAWGMFMHYCNHLNTHTDFYRSRDLSDTRDYVKTGYKEITEDGREVIKGRMNEVYKISFEDNAIKGVGGALNKLIYEEPGIASNFSETFEYVDPNTLDGNIRTGQIIAAGSVGSLDKCKDLEMYFWNPKSYGFRGFENIWEPDNPAKYTGYFVPEYLCMKPFIDNNGNSQIEQAYEDCKQKLDKASQGKNKKSFIIQLTQHPTKPSQAFLSRTGNKFPIYELKQHKDKIEQSRIKDGDPVKLYSDNGIIRYQILPKDEYKRLDDYPITATDDNEGVSWIFEPPQPNTENLYICSTDDIVQDEVSDSESVFTHYIYKKDSGSIDAKCKRSIVACYVGRTNPAETAYDEALNLQLLYNAKGLPESNCLGYIKHVKKKGYSILLQDSMDEIKGINPGAQAKRSKGYNSTVEVKNEGDNLILAYLTEILGYEYKDEEKTEILRPILGLERIPDIGLLRELIAYTPDRNVDRMTAFRGILLYEDATRKRVVSFGQDSSNPLLAFANDSVFKIPPTGTTSTW